MKERMLILISLCLSIAGVGFMYYQSEAAEPTPLGPAVGDQIDDYVSLAGVVSRYREKNGNIFIVVRGEAEVEVPLFYGTALHLERIPSLGDWVEVQGMLTAVEEQYLRPYWPHYQVMIERHDHVTVLGRADAQALDKAIAPTLGNAGKAYDVSGTITECTEEGIVVDGIPLCLDAVCRIGDSVSAEVLLVEDNGALSTVVLSIQVGESSPIPPAEAQESGEAYHVAGTVTDVRAYYRGLKIMLAGEGGAIPVYCPQPIGVFSGDSVDVRGLLRPYYGENVLYVVSMGDIAVTGHGAVDAPERFEQGERYVLRCSVLSVEYKGSHPIYTLSTQSGRLYAHLYAEERDNLRRRDKSEQFLQVGVECDLLVEITANGENNVCKIIDFRDIDTMHK